MNKKILLGVAMALPALAPAQTLTTKSLSPARYALGVAHTTPVGATFSQPLRTASAAAVRVYGQQSGRLAGTTTVTDAQLSFQPGRSLHAGEVVSVTLPATLQSLDGQTLGQPQVYQFTARAGAGTLRFALGPNTTPVGGARHAADVNGDGNVDLVGASSDWVSVRLGDGQGGFRGGSDQNAQVEASVLGDFDGDGDPDLAIGPTRVLFNNGQGQFSGTTSASGFYANTLAAGDLDADGDLDLVAGYGYSFTASFRVLLNNGQGVFTPAGAATTVPYGGSEPSIGDLDGDGDLDLVIGGRTLYLNQGPATFTNAGMMLDGITSTLATLADLDGDSDLDMVLSVGAARAQVALNNGLGKFTPGQQLPLPGDTQTFGDPVDLDGDGDLDLPIYSRAGDVYSIPTYTAALWLNNGTAQFPTSFDLAAVWAVPADFDNDGDLDLLATDTRGVMRVRVQLDAAQTTTLALTAHSPAAGLAAVPRASPVSAAFSAPLAAGPATERGISIFGSQRAQLPSSATQRGNALVRQPTQPYFPNERVAVSVRAGLAATNNSQLATGQVFEFTAAASGGTGTFGPYITLPGIAPARNLFTVDMNNDGLLDLLNDSGQLSLNLGNGKFTPYRKLAGNTSIADLTPGDFDSDGDLDLAIATSVYNGSSYTAKLLMYLNDGQAQFTAGQVASLGVSPVILIGGDLDADGDWDVLATGGSGSIAAYLNDGEGRLQLVNAVNLTTSHKIIALGDLNGDGLLDLVTANGAKIAWYKGLGTGEFEATASSTVTVPGSSITLADLDGDNDLDLLTTTNDQVSTRFNDGSGQFSGGASFSVPSFSLFTAGLATGDIDGDSDLDIVVGGGDLGSQVAVRYNNGAGSFSGTYNPVVAPSSTMPVTTALADLDGDGDLDLAVSRANYSDLSVCFNGSALLATTPAGNASSSYLIYPNPAQAAASLVGAPAHTTVQLLDYLGREVGQTTVRQAGVATPLPVAGLAAGVYVVRVGAQALKLTIE
jgi:hypothetical protein